MLSNIREGLTSDNPTVQASAIELVLSILSRVKLIDLTGTEVDEFVRLREGRKC